MTSHRARLGCGAIITTMTLGGLLMFAGTGAHAASPVPTPAYTLDQSEAQAALVAGEDDRLVQVRAIAAVAPFQGKKWTVPYRLDTGNGYTLVLTQRSAYYTVADLVQLAPQTFTRRPDGSYLLTENIYLDSGAKLKLASPGGLTVRLASSKGGFVSIVSFGGQIAIAGTRQAPVTITSWDPRTRLADTDVTDGRAYIRAIGGQFSMAHASVSDLGFWSGRTGGISLTGTERPDIGDLGVVVGHRTKSQRHADKEARLAEVGSPPETLASGQVSALPAGPIMTPDTRFEIPAPSYVSGTIDNSSITGNAFGLFVSSASGVFIADTRIVRSLGDGLVLHRFASSAVVERTESVENGGDGFVLARATEDVRISNSKALSNGRNGFTLNGNPLADGPSASGASIVGYGANSVSNSEAKANKRYGVEVLGGTGVGLQNNIVVGGEMGIVVRQAATAVSVTGNQLEGHKHGISVRDGVRDAAVTGNVVEKAVIGIYIRDSAARVRGNTVQGATSHAVTVVGDSSSTVIANNTASGIGPSALDTSRSRGVKLSANHTGDWKDTTPFWKAFRRRFSPMTVLWSSIALLIVLSQVRRHASRTQRRAQRAGLTVRTLPYAETGSLIILPATPLVGTTASREYEMAGAPRE